jgi:hypothetical protein
LLSTANCRRSPRSDPNWTASRAPSSTAALGSPSCSSSRKLAGPVEEQVIAIYAGTKGFLDDLAVDDVRAFETALLQNFRASRADLLESIRTTKALPPADQLDQAIAEVKKGFATTKPEISATAAAAPATDGGPAEPTTPDAPAPEAVTAGAAPEGRP